MPCVFPVLAIKVLAFAQHADDRAAHRRSGLAYTAGVVLSFSALGGLLLGCARPASSWAGASSCRARPWWRRWRCCSR